MLSVLHINKFHYLRGGSELVYFQTAELLKSHGHRSFFFSMHHPENIECETANYFLPNIDLNRQNGAINQIKTAGRILYSLKAKKLLAKLLDNYHTDIAHLHNIHHQISPSILHILKKRKIPVVMTLHDYKMVCASYNMIANGKLCEACSSGRYYNAALKHCVKNSLVKSALSAFEMYLHHNIMDIYNNVDIFIAPSMFLKNKLAEMGFKKKIVYISNVIDAADIRNKITETKQDLSGDSIVYFGRLSEEKGLWTLIEAAKLFSNRSRGSKLKFKIIGDGALRKQLEDKVKAESIDNVRFYGYLSGEALYSEIRNSLAVVLPSEWYENNPISVLEAFALEKPVIGARIGGIPELVKGNKTGLIFEAGNAEDLSLKIAYLVNNSDEARNMGENARIFVEQELTAKKYYERLIYIYKELTN